MPPLSQPVAPSERIEIVDVIRGFALFGVLLVNMLSFSGPYLTFEPWTLSTTLWDRTVELLILTLGQGAFYSIFSFLFGLSYAMQANRAAARGEDLSRTARSRMIWLFVFGLLHGFLVWDGDILASYATAGFFLAAFANTGARKTLKWATWLILSMVGLPLIILISIIIVVPEFLNNWQQEPSTIETAAEIEMYGEGRFSDLALYRLQQWPFLLVAILVHIPWFLGLFLLGLWAVKSGKLANWRNERLFTVRVLKISLPAAITSKMFLAYTILVDVANYTFVFAFILDYWLSLSLGVTYLCFILIYFQKYSLDRSVFHHLQPVGRMALTNYLFQSIIAVIFFYGIGFGFYGQLGLGATCLIAILLFGMQIVFSRLWLNRYRFGPMEWLWRILTYKTKIG